MKPAGDLGMLNAAVNLLESFITAGTLDREHADSLIDDHRQALNPVLALV